MGTFALALAFAGNDGRNSRHEITLKFHDILHSFFLHEVLNMLILFPQDMTDFISSEVNVFRRKYGCNFSKHIIKELIYLLIRRIQRIGSKLMAPHMVSLAERHHIIRIERIIDSQFRIINKHRPAMSRHVYFRNNLHMAGSSISHQILQFFLRIEPASSFRPEYNSLL